jgi:hypothetical protein
MEANCDKVIVTNVSAFTKKYGQGYGSIKNAVDGLIARLAKPPALRPLGRYCAVTLS